MLTAEETRIATREPAGCEADTARLLNGSRRRLPAQLPRLYHGTDLKTARRIVREGRLYGNYPIFGAGVCTTASRALGFATRKTPRRHTRSLVSIVPKQPFILGDTCIAPDNTICFLPDTEKGAYTAHSPDWEALKYIEVEARIIPAKEYWQIVRAEQGF